MATTRVVTGPVVVLPQQETRLLGYYYQGATLPDGLDEDRIADAIRDGLVREDVDLTELTVDDLSAALAGDRLRAAGTGFGEMAVEPVADDGDEGEGGDAAPPKAAPKSAWVDYAIAQGADEAWARDEDTTKAQLIERYGA